MMRHSLELLFELTRKEIKIRYKNSFLGYFWSILNPLMMAGVFYFVFQIIARMDMQNYALFLVTGLFIWQWMTNSLQMGSMLFVGHAGLIKKVIFPRNLLAVAMILSEGFNFIFTIPIVLGLMLYSGLYPTLYWLLLPIYLLVIAIFIYGIALFVGTINTFFRDLERVINVLMLLMFYATPILYPMNKIPEAYHYILYINPFTPFVIVWRDLMLDGKLNTEFLLYSTGYALAAYILGTFVFEKMKFKFAELV